MRAQQQAEQSHADLGLRSSTAWPVERYFFVPLVVAFLVAHLSIPIRHFENTHAPARWNQFRGWITIVYWASMLVPPTFISVWCWIKVYKTRDWERNFDWIGLLSTENWVSGLWAVDRHGRHLYCYNGYAH